MAGKKKKKDRSGNIIGEIQRIHFLYERAFDQLYNELGISNEQFNVLDILSENIENGLALNEVQAELPNQTSNTTRLVNKLQGKKLLTKKPDPQDNRRLIIKLTDDGKAILDQAKKLSKPINKTLKKASSSIEAKALQTQLKGLRKALENSKAL